MTIGLTHYLILAALLFCCGLFVMTTKRNAVGILIGVELVLNAACLNLVAFSRYRVGTIDGQIAALFIIVLAAAVYLAVVLWLGKRAAARIAPASVPAAPAESRARTRPPRVVRAAGQEAGWPSGSALPR